MAYSVLDLCNWALSRIGIMVPIADLDEASNEAIQCKLFYAIARDKVLFDFAWPFASHYADLTLVEEDPNTEWGYSYRYPPDCLHDLRVAMGRTSPSAPYTLSSDVNGKLVLTDVSEAVLFYTGRFTDPAFFDPAFASALAWRLAFELAKPLSRSAQERQDAREEYQAEITQAQAGNANSGQIDPPPEAASVQARD